MSEEEHFLKKHLEKAQIKERATIYNISRQRCFSSHYAALLWQSLPLCGMFWQLASQFTPFQTNQ